LPFFSPKKTVTRPKSARGIVRRLDSAAGTFMEIGYFPN
jgi:hypothetical protein